MLISGLNNGFGLPANSDQTNQNGRISAAFLPASLVVSLASQQQRRQVVQQQDIVPAYPKTASMGASLQFPIVPPGNQFQHHTLQQPAMNMNTNFHLSFGQENGRALSALAFHQPVFPPPPLATTKFGNDLSSSTNLHQNEMRIRFQQQQQNQLFQLHRNQTSQSFANSSMQHLYKEQQIKNLMLQSANIASISARDSNILAPSIPIQNTRAIPK